MVLFSVFFFSACLRAVGFYSFFAIAFSLVWLHFLLLFCLIWLGPCSSHLIFMLFVTLFVFLVGFCFVLVLGLWDCYL